MLSIKHNDKPVYPYRPCVKTCDSVPVLSSIKATILVFDDVDLVLEEHRTFFTREELNRYANYYASSEAAHGHTVKIIWKESLVCQGQIVFL